MSDLDILQTAERLVDSLGRLPPTIAIPALAQALDAYALQNRPQAALVLAAMEVVKRRAEANWPGVAP